MRQILDILINLLTSTKNTSNPPIDNQTYKPTGHDVAENYRGMQEVKDKKKLMELFKKHTIMDPSNSKQPVDPETTAWCSAFVTACEREVGNPGTGSLMGR